MIDRLRDIDEAEDLQEAASDEFCDSPTNALLNLVISVVIPVFNEEKGVGGLLEGLRRVGGGEGGGGRGVDLLDVVVVDGGSEDGTVQAVHDWVNELVSSSSSSSSPISLPSPFFRLQVVTSPLRGRGHQMNYGAAHCISPLILFLHADTHLKEGRGFKFFFLSSYLFIIYSFIFF